MGKFRSGIESIMADDGTNRFLSAEWFLHLISIFYGAVSNIRAKLYIRGVFSKKKLPCPVISIGNIAAGGTGKTPMAIYTANLLKSLQYRTAVISRGYKGRDEKTGGIVSSGKDIMMRAESAGDEPVMMARVLKDIPVVIGRNRYKAGIKALEKFQPDVIILDDGFQHLKLARDIDIVLLDHARPLGNGRLLPRGLLREPVSALKRGDLFVFTRSDAPQKILPDKMKSFLTEKPVFNTARALYQQNYLWRTKHIKKFDSK